VNRNSFIWLSVFFVVLIWSAIGPHDRITWWLEVLPALVGLVLIAVTRNSFPLTPILYGLILVHAVILMVGGHYTYAEVPLGDWMREWFNSDRNNYDKIGHFAQGFIPAILTREILVRKEVVRSGAWLGFIVVSICLAFSAFYELLEWAAAMLSAEAAEAFLGTQGYVWDTQSDMLWAMSGAILSLFLLSHVHDRQLKNVKEGSG
jgi:putative membrane protein